MYVTSLHKNPATQSLMNVPGKDFTRAAAIPSCVTPEWVLPGVFTLHGSFPFTVVNQALRGTKISHLGVVATKH